MQIPIVESGTSVAPRQRPNGSVQPVSHTLPLVAPPSPSPRNNLSSPVPSAAIPPSQSADTQEQITPAAEEAQPFTAQFQANFPPIASGQPPVTPQAQQPFSQPSQSTSNSATNINQLDGGKSDDLDSLFESKFPDPFRETAASAAKADSSSSGNIAVSTNIFAQPQDVVMPLEIVAGTPTKTTAQMLGAPKVNPGGHRRNMSDTSAFNK